MVLCPIQTCIHMGRCKAGRSKLLRVNRLRRVALVNCDPSYAKLLKPIVAQNVVGKFLGFGINTMPNLWEMDLVTEQQAIFECFGYSPTGWKVGRPLAPEP